MIKATIAGEEFVLPSLKDAEQLLQILERATPVSSGWIDKPDPHRVLYVSDRDVEIAIEITSRTDLLTREQYQAAKVADAIAKAATAQVPA